MNTRALLVAALLSAAVPVAEPASVATGPSIDRQFTETVRPFVEQYCVVCHSGKTPAANFDLASYTSVDKVIDDHSRWALVIDKLSSKQMPPVGMPAPEDPERNKIIAWIKSMRTEEIRKHAGDPGPVLARRLSNAEYNYTIRDLTGVDIQPAREFPVDPANQAGFDNSGESLAMSPALLNKYLQAAHAVSDHAVLTPDSIDFAETPMLVETDKEKYTIHRIIDFYFSQPTDFADYFAAAWRYKYRVALGHPAATLASTARDSKVSPKYLPLVWGILEEPAAARTAEVGPIKKLQSMWLALPAADAKAKTEPAREKFTAMRDFVVRIRHDSGMQYATPVVKGLPTASEALMDWKLEMFAAHRRDFDPKSLRNDEDPPMKAPTIPRYPGLHADGAPRWAALIDKSRSEDSDLIVPRAQRSKYEASFARFAKVFPDDFYVSERGRYFPDLSQDKGRYLSAGYHNAMGYFRDDTALKELILNDAEIKRIDRLWDEFDFISDWSARTFDQFYYNQAGEVDDKGDEGGLERPVGHAVTDEPVVLGVKAKYLAFIAKTPTADPNAAGAVTEHFDRINATFRYLEKERAASEPKHLDALLKFAAKAYRRPLTKAESADILAYYHELRDKRSLSHEDAIRDSLTSILMSPDFCYRIDTASNPTALATPSTAGVPLSAYALASRLSYFLWSSMPDAELLAHAASGDLETPEVLLAQTRRMMKDDKIRDFATEFGGNWLEIRRFENHNGVDRDRFPVFTNALREAMFQEPIRFIEDVVKTNRNVFDMLYGKDTFVNPVLAKHYGIPMPADPKAPQPVAPPPVVPAPAAVGASGGRGASGPGRAGLPNPNEYIPPPPDGNDRWIHVADADKYQRGGLIPMAVFMTQNSPGLRTSPVKRGHWLVSRVLGEVIPPPPPVVPELPHDEAKTDLPIRDLLAQHRANPVCAGCHQRFDVFGLALEGYGPVGETRTKDLGGRTIDASTTLPGGVNATGLSGVQAYIKDRREPGYVDGLSRKLLSYALGRSLLISDEPLIARMESRLALNGNKFDTLIETIVTSSQFRNRRSAPLTSTPKNATMIARGSSK